MQAWNGWLHCNGSTFGTWLRGDPRGWRSRRHREHCEGDYKNPPPKGKFDKEYQRSKNLMKRDGVELSIEARKLACETMVKALQFHGVEVIALCVGKTGWHALVRLPNKKRDNKSLGTAVPRRWRNRIARHFMGIAKKESARALSRAKLSPPGGVWAAGCGVKPVKDRKHQVNAFKYIRDHLEQGAYVWLYTGEVR